MKKTRRQKCRNCKRLFAPNPRNRSRQRYCSEPDCRAASKAASQAKWRQSEAGATYFCGPEHVERVRQWRLVHPGYSRDQVRSKKPLQDLVEPQHPTVENINSDLDLSALQDPLAAQLPLFVGLIAQLTGSTLQDDIARTVRALQTRGADVLGPKWAGEGNWTESQSNP